MTIALAGKRITPHTDDPRNWAIVYIANLMGSIIIAFLIFNTEYSHLEEICWGL